MHEDLQSLSPNQGSMGIFPGMGKDQLNQDAVECERALGTLGPDVSSVKLLGLSLSFSSDEVGIKLHFTESIKDNIFGN